MCLAALTAVSLQSLFVSEHLLFWLLISLVNCVIELQVVCRKLLFSLQFVSSIVISSIYCLVLIVLFTTLSTWESCTFIKSSLIFVQSSPSSHPVGKVKVGQFNSSLSLHWSRVVKSRTIICLFAFLYGILVHIRADSPTA